MNGPERFHVTRKGREALIAAGVDVEIRECSECGRATTFADGKCLPCALATGQAPAVEDAGAEEAEVFRREPPAGDAALLRDAERLGMAIEREARARRFRAVVDEAADRAGE